MSKKTKKNALQSLVDIYEQSVSDENKKGFAEKFKTCTELFFKQMDHYMQKRYSGSCTVEDVEYLDGYFIFGFGTNSVVHFHIKECPGWLFAIWWDQPEKKEIDGKMQYPNYISGTFFTQFEETIDKFKPSRSAIQSILSICPEDSDEESRFSEAAIVNFIHVHPELAFCRDYHGWNYNTEYRTEEEAKMKYKEYREWQDNKDLYSKANDDMILNFVREKILPTFVHADIEDHGDNWSPRYEIIAPAEENGAPKHGIYSWFDDDSLEGQQLLNEYHTLVDKCSKISDEHDFFWSSPISEDVLFYTMDDINEDLHK